MAEAQPPSARVNGQRSSHRSKNLVDRGYYFIGLVSFDCFTTPVLVLGLVHVHVLGQTLPLISDSRHEIYLSIYLSMVLGIFIQLHPKISWELKNPSRLLPLPLRVAAILLLSASAQAVRSKCSAHVWHRWYGLVAISLLGHSGSWWAIWPGPWV